MSAHAHRDRTADGHTLLGRASEITPPAIDRMHDRSFPQSQCPATIDLDDQVKVTVGGITGWHWGCYRLQGHTCRHLGILSESRTEGDSDYWVVWS